MGKAFGDNLASKMKNNFGGLGGAIMKVLITGGTGTLGSELIKRFYEQGKYEITFTYNSNFEKAQSLANQFLCRAIRIENIEDNYDIIINNAALVTSLVRFEDVSLQDWEETLKVNLTTPFAIIKKNLPHMRHQNWGRIINVSSVYGVRAEEDFTPYVASKHGLMGLTKMVAKEYAQYGITCNAICPGTIESALSSRLADCYTSNSKERTEYFEELNDAIPAGRLVYPHEIANLILFIASNEASYINGACLMIDGGYTS